MIILIILPIIAYLFGSINPAVWVSKRFFDIDIREHGSKNAGATNVLRVLGPRAALPVFAFDIFKGFVAVSLYHLAQTHNLENNISDAYKILLAACVVVGHIFPIFSGFKGGKGVATILGAAMALEPSAAGVGALVFLVVYIYFCASRSGPA
jgi:glycerol-3-phosphate acyltransferase PlsY